MFVLVDGESICDLFFFFFSLFPFLYELSLGERIEFLRNSDRTFYFSFCVIQLSELFDYLKLDYHY